MFTVIPGLKCVLQLMTRPSVRARRWLGLAIASLIVAGAVPVASASNQPMGSGDTTPQSNTTRALPFPCDRLMPGPLCPPAEPTSTVRCHDWFVATAWTVDARARLVVSAVCKARGGERLELRRVEPQGINPANLLLELVVYRSPFPESPASREVRVAHFERYAGYKKRDDPSRRPDALGRELGLTAQQPS